jgi:hypothetical protein
MPENSFIEEDRKSNHDAIDPKNKGQVGYQKGYVKMTSWLMKDVATEAELNVKMPTKKHQI